MEISADRLEKFKKVVIDTQGSLVIVMTQVDLDAIGSAMLLAAILEKIKPDALVKIFYSGVIGHPQNEDVFNSYNLDQKIKPIGEWAGDKGDFLILVDSSSTNDSRLPHQLATNPLIVIDHHKPPDIEESPRQFIWVESVGATCTLLIELCYALKIDIDFTKDKWRHLTVLTALGIYSDTSHLVNASRRDREAYGQITKDLEPEELNRFLQYTFPDEYNDIFARALLSRMRNGSRLVAGVGVLQEKEGDYLSIIAEHFLQTKGITLAIVWGILDGAVKLSARSTDKDLNLDSFLKKRFGKDAAGGKRNSYGRSEGGGKVPFDLGVFQGNSEESRKLIERYISIRMQELIFKL